MAVRRASLAAAAGLCAAGPLLFAAPASRAVQPSQGAEVSLRGTPAAARAPTSSSAPSAGAALAGAAAVAVGVGAARTTRATKKQQRAQVVANALGSIEQFQVFGPPEDPFQIETDKILGVGGQGTVYLCHRQSNPAVKFAVKTIPIWRLLMDPSCDEKIAEIRKETEVLMKIQGHPNVCRCEGCFDAFRPGTSQAQYIMIVMELVNGGELASFIKDGQNSLPEDVAKNVIRQTVQGLKYCHDQQVVHRDLKCENVLVCAEQLTATTEVKLIDFGVAKYIAGTLARSCVGTTEIMAPELVSAKLMMAPKGAQLARHGPYTFNIDASSPGFGIITQRPDGKGAMVNGIEPGGQAEKNNVGDGWAIEKINDTVILEMPFVKDFNELGAGTAGGVTAIAEMLGTLKGDFTMTFVELPKREFTTAVDLWSLGVMIYQMVAGVSPFKDEAAIVNGVYDEAPLAGASPQVRELIKGLLVLDPTQRMNINQVIAHPWLA